MALHFFIQGKCKGKEAVIISACSDRIHEAFKARILLNIPVSCIKHPVQCFLLHGLGNFVTDHVKAGIEPDQLSEFPEDGCAEMVYGTDLRFRTKSLLAAHVFKKFL